MKGSNYHIITIGYCQAQTLLKYSDIIAHSNGQYGWACDYYEIDDILISTGYSPIASKNTNLSYFQIDKYEKKAQKLDDYMTPYEKRKKAINKLLSKMIKEAITPKQKI